MSSFDGLSLTNTRDGIFNHLSLIYNNDVVNIFDIFALRGDITTLSNFDSDTIAKLQTLSNDITSLTNLYNYINGQLVLKSNISDVYYQNTTNSLFYNKTYIDNLISQYNNITTTTNLLNNKLDSSEIVKYYTKTQSSNLFLDINTFNTNMSSITSSLNLKVDTSTLANYYNINTTNSTFYNKSYIDNLISQYDNRTTVSNTLTNYYNKSYIDTNITPTLNSHTTSISNLNNTISSTINTTTLSNTLANYYNSNTVGSLITGLTSIYATKATLTNDYFNTTYITNMMSNYYNKANIDGLISQYYTKTETDTLLDAKLNVADADSLYYDKFWIDNHYLSISNFTSASLVSSSKLNDYYNLTTTNSLYATNTTVNGLSNTTSSLISGVNNINLTLPSLLTTTTGATYLTKASFSASSLINTTTLGSYLTLNNFSSSSLVNTTTLGSYLTLNNFSSSSLVNSTTLGSYLTTNNLSSLSLVNTTTLGSYLTTNNLSSLSLVNTTTLGSYLTTANFSASSLVNTTTLGSYLTNQNFTNASLVTSTQLSNLNTTTNNNITVINNLTLTVNSNITSINNLNITIGSLITNSTLASNLSNYATTTSLSGLTNTTNSNITLITNLTNTVGSLITSSTLTSRLTGYATTTSLTNLNTTVNSTITSISNLSNTVGSLITNATLTSRLNTKLDKNIYSIPSLPNDWALLGSISTSQTGNVSVFEIYSQDFTNGYPFHETRGVIQFSTSNGSTWSINGNNGTPFYGEATFHGTNNFSNLFFAIQQVSTTLYNFYYQTGPYPGNSFFVVNSNDTFTYSGTQVNPSGCFINPTKIYTVGLDNYNSGNMYVDNIRSLYYQSQNQNFNIYDWNSVNLATFNASGSTIYSTLFANTCSSNFLALGTSQGALYNYKYTGFNSLVLSHPFAMQFAITNSVPPLTTTNTNILMTFDASTGVDVNAFLSCETSFSVLGTTNLGAPIISDITCNKSLYVSGGSTLRGNLTVSGTTNLGGTICRGSATNSSSLFVSGATTLNSTLNILDTTNCPNINVSNNITCNTLFSLDSLCAYNPVQASNVLLCNNYYLKNSSTYAWITYSGTYSNLTDTAPYQQLTLTSTSYDMYGNFLNYKVKQNIRVSMDVKLGTAPNFVVIVNNTTAWDTVGGICFTTAQLNTTSYTNVSYSFNVPSSGKFNIHLGAHSQTGVTQQSPGTVFIRNVSIANNEITSSKAINVSGDNTYGTSVSYINTPVVCNSLQINNGLMVGSNNITGSNSLFLNGMTNGTALYNGSNMCASFTSIGNGLYYNTSVIQNLGGGDSNLKVQNTASGTSSLYLMSNTTVGSRIYQDPGGNLNVAVNVSQTSVLPISIYPSGVVNVNAPNSISNKIMVFYEGGASDAPSTATNYSGIGTQSGGAMRYQVTTATNTHRFFCGTTQSFFITNGSGASGSDSRWKSDVQNITNGLSKVKQLQGKTFIYNNCDGRQMGLIAQEVQPIVPEVVLENDGYYLLCYDRLVALLIESVKELESRVAALENV